MVCYKAGDTRGPYTQTFLGSKKKKREIKKKNERSFKAETIKRLSPRSKCYCFSHSRASRIQFFLSSNYGGQHCSSMFRAHFAGPALGVLHLTYYV